MSVDESIAFLRRGAKLAIYGVCSDCPHAKLLPGQGDISNDESEAYYACGLLQDRKVWGESPECDLKAWLPVLGGKR